MFPKKSARDGTPQKILQEYGTKETPVVKLPVIIHKRKKE
jgi:hypothetical protein